MNFRLVTFSFTALLAFQGCRTPSSNLQEVHIGAHVPDRSSFDTFLMRDLTARLEHTHGKGLKVSYELLRAGPTQVGTGYPKYYLWVRVEMANRTVDEGAIRVAAVERRGFEVGNFISKTELVSSPERIEQEFPLALKDAIRARTGAK
ncbi:MAG: Uncharacterized protein FD161_3682 [Limisphaerales bacterium]|nr:MAG: Uncharacterized protein FD161_3682 [Limisphaerales bacterium]TXT48621.1 MAG: Uncharacterized protein FD140_3556 [Limisphaerales bacterium]